MNITYRLFLASTLFIAACSSGSSESKTFIFRGDWDVTYNVVADACGLLSEGFVSFIDEQTVSGNNAPFGIVSFALPSGSYSASQRAEDSILAERVDSGDLFGIGLQCTTVERLSYDDLDGDIAGSLYTFQLTCVDGTICESVFSRCCRAVVE